MTIANKIVLDGGIVYGPSSSVNNRVAVFDGVTGKIIKDSGLQTSNILTKIEGMQLNLL